MAITISRILPLPSPNPLSSAPYYIYPKGILRTIRLFCCFRHIAGPRPEKLHSLPFCSTTDFERADQMMNPIFGTMFQQQAAQLSRRRRVVPPFRSSQVDLQPLQLKKNLTGTKKDTFDSLPSSLFQSADSFSPNFLHRGIDSDSDTNLTTPHLEGTSSKIMEVVPDRPSSPRSEEAADCETSRFSILKGSKNAFRDKQSRVSFSGLRLHEF